MHLSKFQRVPWIFDYLLFKFGHMEPLKNYYRQRYIKDKKMIHELI